MGLYVARWRTAYSEGLKNCSIQQIFSCNQRKISGTCSMQGKMKKGYKVFGLKTTRIFVGNLDVIRKIILKEILNI
jgi:hypothetical protein